jgi:AraC-like DNA-binding protein
MDESTGVMYKSLIMKRVRIYNEERFRTPLAAEQALGLWVDRVGWRQEDILRPEEFRVLGQYAAVAIEAGAGVLETVAHGTHTLKEGDVILLTPRVATLYYPRRRWDTRWVVWNGPEAAVLERFSGQGPGVPVIRGAAAAVLRAWRQVDPLMERQDFDAVLGRKSALLDLLRELSAHHRAEGGWGEPPFLATALRALSRSEGPPETVASLARRLHMSPAHFRRQFKANTGSSPKTFQLAQRVTRAKELLADGHSIKVTADTLGFTDVFHFMRLFRRVTGQTAGQFAAAFAKGPADFH